MRAADNLCLTLAAVTNPMEVCKTRMQLQGELQKAVAHGEVSAKATQTRLYNSAIDCFAKTLRSEGIKGVQRGLGAAYIYQVLLNGSRLGFYEPFRKAINTAAGKDVKTIWGLARSLQVHLAAWSAPCLATPSSSSRRGSRRTARTSRSGKRATSTRICGRASAGSQGRGCPRSCERDGRGDPQDCYGQYCPAAGVQLVSGVPVPVEHGQRANHLFFIDPHRAKTYLVNIDPVASPYNRLASSPASPTPSSPTSPRPSLAVFASAPSCSPPTRR